MTYRERRERRAERLREWAEKRQERAAAVLASHEVYRGDVAFNTQPGHIPERARVIAQADRAYESLRKAENMDRRATGIEAQLDGAIYSDDPDAIPALEARIEALEAERERRHAMIDAYNATVKAGAPDMNLLDPDSQRTLRAFPELYAGRRLRRADYTGNLSANIKRNYDRLADLRRRAAFVPEAVCECGAAICVGPNGWWADERGARGRWVNGEVHEHRPEESQS